MAYTGWWPNSYKVGQGIGVIDSNIIYQGEWQPVDDFPNSGRDIYTPQHLLSYNMFDLTQREMPRGFFGGRGKYEVIMAQDDTIEEIETPFWDWWMSKERWWNRDNYVAPEPKPTQDEEEYIKGPDDYDFYFDITINWG